MKKLGLAFLNVAAKSIIFVIFTGAAHAETSYTEPEYVQALINGDIGRIARSDWQAWDTAYYESLKLMGDLGTAVGNPLAETTTDTFARQMKFSRRQIFRTLYVLAFAHEYEARCSFLPQDRDAEIQKTLDKSKAWAIAVMPTLANASGSYTTEGTLQFSASTLFSSVQNGANDARKFLTTTCDGRDTAKVLASLASLLTPGLKPAPAGYKLTTLYEFATGIRQARRVSFRRC